MGQALFNYMTSSLSKEFLRDRNIFWNSSYPDSKIEYAKLNNVLDIDDKMIHDAQFEALASIARSISGDSKIKKIGEQILKVDQIKINNNILEETVINETLETISSLYSVGKVKQDKKIISIANSEQAYSKSFLAIQALNELTKNTTGAYSREVLEKTNALLDEYKKYIPSGDGNKYYKALSGTGFGQDENLLWFFKNLKSIQGSLMEERATEWLENKIPLIEELFGEQKMAVLNIGLLSFGKKQPPVDISLINIQEGVKIKYKLGKNGNFKEVTLQQFLKLLDNINNTSERIILNDESVETLSGLMKLNIQAKSGKGQKPFNKITLTLSNLTTPQNALGKMSAYTVFYSMQQLERETWNRNKEILNTQDDGKYSAIANYALSTYMGNIMHYGLQDINTKDLNNQFLLTPNGFMTYGERMQELLEATEYIKLKGNINISGTMLIQPHEVIMPHPFWYYNK